MLVFIVNIEGYPKANLRFRETVRVLLSLVTLREANGVLLKSPFDISIQKEGPYGRDG